MEESVYQILTGRGSPCEMKYARPAMALPGVSRFAASRWARAALSTNVESTRLSPDPPSIKRLATHRLRWWEKLGIAWAPDQMRSKRHGRETVAVGLDHEAFGCGFSGQVRRQIFFGKGFLLVSVANVASAESDAGRARIHEPDDAIAQACLDDVARTGDIGCMVFGIVTPIFPPLRQHENHICVLKRVGNRPRSAKLPL